MIARPCSCTIDLSVTDEKEEQKLSTRNLKKKKEHRVAALQTKIDLVFSRHFEGSGHDPRPRDPLALDDVEMTPILKAPNAQGTDSLSLLSFFFLFLFQRPVFFYPACN